MGHFLIIHCCITKIENWLNEKAHQIMDVLNPLDLKHNS